MNSLVLIIGGGIVGNTQRDRDLLDVIEWLDGLLENLNSGLEIMLYSSEKERS